MKSVVIPEKIQPVHADFRDLSVPEAFSWDSGIRQTAMNGLYVVAFRSKRNLDAPSQMVDRLLKLDHDAFEEAQTMPGFHTYWHDDDLSPEGHGLSFCLWDSKADAKHAAAQPLHEAAVRYAYGEGRSVYSHYTIHTSNVFRWLGDLSVRFDEAI